MSHQGLSESDLHWLERARIPLRVACTHGDGWPLIASLWFLVDEGSLWCATPAGARIVPHLRRDERCAVEVATHVAPYSGIRMRAVASLVTERGDEVLGRLIDRYLGGRTSELAQWLLGRADDELAIRLDPIRVSRWDYGARMQGQLPFHA